MRVPLDHIDTNFNFPMTNVTFLAYFVRMNIKDLLDLKRTSILNFSALLLFGNSNNFTFSLVDKDER